MAYERQQVILTPGGLNLLAPGDRVEASDSIGLKNFRADGMGALRSRLTNNGTGVILTGYIHTLYRWGDLRFLGAYQGGQTLIYKATAGTDQGAVAGGGGFDAGPLSMVGLRGCIWVMNRAKQGRIETPGGTPAFRSWLPAPPASVASPTPVAGGELAPSYTYRYWLTYVQSDGSETNPSNEVEFLADVTNRTAQLTRPAAADARTTHWNVYRIGNTLPEVYRVNATPILISVTTFDDDGTGSSSDLEVTRLGIVMETDHDQPPACRGVVGPYYSRLVAWSTAANPNRLFFTKAGSPFYWPVAFFVDVGDDGDPIVRVVQHQGHLRIYKARSIWRLRGDPETGVVERTNAEVGLVGFGAIDTSGVSDYFQAYEGIYRYDGDQVRRISHKIDPLFRGELALPRGMDTDLQGLRYDSDVRSLNVLAVKNGRLYFSYCNLSSSGSFPTARPNQMLTCLLETGDWASETAPSGTQPASYTALCYEGQYLELLGAGPLGIIYALEYPLPEASAIPLRWVSGYVQPGPRDRMTRWADAVIEHSVVPSAAANVDLTVKLRVDNFDSADVEAGGIRVASTAADPRRNVAVLPFGTDGKGVWARNAAFLLEGNCKHELAVYSVTLHFYLEPRDARTFDTNRTNCGDPRVKEFDLLELDIWNRGVITWDLQTDLPGNALASRATSTFAAVTDRVPKELPLDPAAVNGRLVQVVLTSPEFFWLYGARLRYRAIGLYLDSAQAWKSAMVNLGAR